MSSGALLFATMPIGGWSPTILNLSMYYEANYAGAPWAARSSAGASLANGDLVTAGADPSNGATQNGYTPPDFNGTTQYLTNATASSTLFTAAAGTIIALFRADTANAPVGTVYGDPALHVDTSGTTGLTFTTTGFNGFTYDGAYKTNVVAAATGAYHLVMMRWDGSNLGMTLNSAAEVTTACGNASLSGNPCQVGKGYGGTFIDGRVLMLMTSATKISATEYASLKAYINTKYALAL